MQNKYVPDYPEVPPKITNMAYIKRFAKSLRKNKTGICNYAKYQLTSARIEGGNVSIGMIRKRARGIRDTEYFKLKKGKLRFLMIVACSIYEHKSTHKTVEEPKIHAIFQ